jgi:2-phosphosulfolactate phosphatase
MANDDRGRLRNTARIIDRVEVRYLSTSEADVQPHAVAVVVDVMRAFTVAAWAFARGASSIVLSESLEAALAYKAEHPDAVALRDGHPSAGFDTVNSPAVVSGLNLHGRTVVQKTTNGTVGAWAVRDAGLVLCASFAVAGATARFLRSRRVEEVTFVITGDDGHAEEDLACAQYMAERLTDDQADSAAFRQRAARSAAAVELGQAVRRGIQGIHADDVALCLEVDQFPFVMVAEVEDSYLVLRQVAVSDGKAAGSVSP